MILDAALSLARKGFAVIPVTENDKPPTIKSWQDKATRLEPQIRQWFNRNPALNVGIATAKYWPNNIEHHLVVIDLDVKHEKNGIAAWDTLAAEHGGMTATLTATTASGGKHLFYTVPEPLGNGVDVLALGIDVRSTGGYVVGAGSKINGKQYRFEDESVPVAQCPEWLYQKLRARRLQSERAPNANEMQKGVDPARAQARAIKFLSTAPIATEGNGGDSATFKLAAALRDMGCTESQALNLMSDWNQRCEPPWSDSELSDKVRNAYAYGKNAIGNKAPEAVFGTVVDPLNSAESWAPDEIERNTEHLLQLRRRDSTRFDALVAHWVSLELVDPEKLCRRLDNVAATNAGLDVEEIREEAAQIARPTNQKGLAVLKAIDPEAFARISDCLIRGGIEERQLARAMSAGANILRAEASERVRNNDGRILVQFNAGNAVAVVDAIEDALLRDDVVVKDDKPDPVFSFASGYVTVRQSKPVTVRELGGSDYPPMTLIKKYDLASMTERIVRCVRLESVDQKGNPKAISIPESIVRALLSRQGGKAPPLTGIIEAPTIRRDGSVIDCEGYDVQTGLFAQFNGIKFPTVPNVPTEDQALEARVFLEDQVFSEFPFANPVDKTAAAAAVITGLIRPCLCDTAPGFLLSSPTQGTGKTALAQAICHGAYGRPASATSWPSNDEEMSKFLMATLKEGQRAVVFDNIRDGSLVNSAQLATAMTSDNYTARVLGLSETATVPTAVLWLLTGNNVRLAGDMPSRVMEIYLDANDERPDRRTFRRELVRWVAENRPRIVQAAITVVRYYFASGCPNLGVKATRFKGWDQMVRLPLIHAGGQDVGSKFDNAYQDDPVLGAWRDVMQNWHAVFGLEAITIASVLERIDKDTNLFESPLRKLEDSLKVLLDERKGGKMTASSLGRIVGQFANRPTGGVRLRKGVEPRSKTNTWAIELCE